MRGMSGICGTYQAYDACQVYEVHARYWRGMLSIRWGMSGIGGACQA